MKTSLIAIALIIASIVQVNAQDTANLDIQKSNLYWMGSSFMGFNNHHGTVKFKEGYVNLTNGKISGGEFTIDMNTITNLDGKGYNEGLVEHLKNEDFFFTFRYPTAQLTITQVDYIDANTITIKADLIIKSIKKPVKFTALLDYDKKEMLTNFDIDRTRWNILHATEFDTKIKNNMISDTIEFKAQLIFK
ncbi:YceI family protein [Aquimarina brevivitae]|uniref:Polyisoprenoid-binding protein YceI n=1 Tax=Aquimarina brevivitae TaxID=323412 RepID=A0A4Q7P1S6_9FLAO|nr:YceI family protein [Aquimarina brevivitae]RZS93813.1 polyisoprenoid-binding protein YceI [Aquimarina brevivitae]